MSAALQVPLGFPACLSCTPFLLPVVPACALGIYRIYPSFGHRPHDLERRVFILPSATHEAWGTVAALACPPAMRLWSMSASRQQFRPVPEKYMNPLAFLSCRHEKEGTTAAVCPCPAPANGPDAPNGQYGGLSPCWCPPQPGITCGTAAQGDIQQPPQGSRQKVQQHIAAAFPQAQGKLLLQYLTNYPVIVGHMLTSAYADTLAPFTRQDDVGQPTFP